MATIGLFGDEYDECIGLLKMRIEDAGHKARVINLRRFPGVTRATIDADRITHDGINLFEMDAFFLREMAVRDPFFHVQYTKELWATLRERYLDFSAHEADDISFLRAVVEIVAVSKPMVNAPRVYGYRRHMPFELDLLSRRGFSIPSFRVSLPIAGGDCGADESAILDLDEEMTCDVLTFPKGIEAWTQIARTRVEGANYTLIVVGEASLDRAIALPAGETQCRTVERKDLPRDVEETAVRAAGALGAEFAEVELRYSGTDGKVWLIKVDPAPYFAYWEKAFGLGISEPLAKYLIRVAR